MNNLLTKRKICACTDRRSSLRVVETTICESREWLYLGESKVTGQVRLRPSLQHRIPKEVLPTTRKLSYE